MTKRARDLIGKSIVSADTGQRLGTVGDLLIDEDTHALVGLVVTQGMLKAEQVLAAADIRSLGPDVIVSRTNQLIRASEWRTMQQAAGAAADGRSPSRRT